MNYYEEIAYETKMNLLIDLIQDDTITLAVAAEEMEVSEEEFRVMMEEWLQR